MGWDPTTVDSLDMAVHAMLVPGGACGRVLLFGGYLVGDTHLYDVEARALVAGAPTGVPGYNAFCSGHAFLADGRVLVAGGQRQARDEYGEVASCEPEVDDTDHDHGGMTWGGERRCALYHPLLGAWTPAADMNLDPAGNPHSGGRWYPTCTTLPDGQVLAVGGHPFLCEDYPGGGVHRHSNSTPERYSPGGDSWVLLASHPPATNQKTADDGVADYDYQRNHLLPTGRVFFASRVRDQNRFYDPYQGKFLDSPVVALPPEGTYQGASFARYTSVLLPLLHQEGFRPRVLIANGALPYRIDLGADAPSWSKAGNRQWPDPAFPDGTGPLRYFACPVLLPTGEVFFSGGTASGGGDQAQQDAGVKEGEIYDPAIDWNTGAYTAGSQGSWQTVEPAQVVRHYHSTALLLPDGAVWTAGSNGPSDGPGGDRERQIEIYEPWYFGQQGQRPTVSNVPANIGYAYTFRFNVGLASGTSVSRVALLRCGSVTHAFNPDQRLVSVAFTKINATTLEITVPFMPEVLPPGRYLLWVVDDQNRPCVLAPFIRISKQKALFSADFDKIAKSEVEALGPGAHFSNVAYLIYDGFLPDEVTTPTRALVWKEGGQTVPGIQTSLGAPKYEGGFANKDVAQRVVFPCHLTFTNDSAFDAVPDDPGFREMLLEAEMGDFATSVPISLTKKLNPRMSDGDPHWLSIDLRGFTVKAGDPAYTAGVAHPADAGGAVSYIQDLLDEYNGWSEQHPGEQHPFESLPTTQETNRLPLYSHEDGDPVFNFAVAKVRFRAPEGTPAANVRVFFRLWTTGWTALSYSTHKEFGSYPRDGDGAGATPRLGLYGGEISTIPCFAAARSAKMTDQDDPKNLRQLIGIGADELHTYYGCWLDFNQDVARFPLEPSPDDAGPYGGDLKSIQELMRGLHQCLVAEIHYWPDDAIDPGETPASSDNLAQRNLLLDDSDNPGGFASHLVHHTFEMKASPFPFPGAQAAPLASIAATTRLHPDELVIDWGNLPRDSHVTFYMPQLDAAEIVRYAGLRQAPGNLSRLDPHTVRCRVTDVGFLPIPGPLAKNVAGLVSVQLPPNVTKGQKFTFVLRQVDGRTFRVVGTTQFDIHVGTADAILPRFERNLSVLKHIALSIPADNRWYPVFERYLGELADRIRALGGDPEAIEPAPDGGGRSPGTARPPGDKGHSGRVSEILYDCSGAFEGFVLDACGERRVYRSCEKSMEEVVRRACRKRQRVTVLADRAGRPRKLIVHCC